jgi:hypothetical protein
MRKRAALVCLSTLLILSVVFPRSSRSCAPDDYSCLVQEAYGVVRTNLGDAAEELLRVGRGGDRVAASESMGEATDAVDAMVNRAGSDVKLLKKVISFQKKVVKAAATVADGTKTGSTALKSVTAAMVAGDKSFVGKPVLVEVDAKTAGFHNPGDQVTFAIYNVGGEPCTETPVINIVNVFDGEAILPGYVINSDGTFSVTMGREPGGARVTITACGQTSTRLLYNYGPKAVKGVPAGFPTDLEPGNYQLCFSIDGIETCPPILLPLTNLKSFAQIVVTAINTVTSSLVLPPGCTVRSWYGAATDTSFSFSFSATCCDPDVGCATETVVFTIRKV